MNISQRYRFSPGPWPTLATLLLLPLFLSLGFWQLDRAEQKARLQAEFSERYNSPTVVLNDVEKLDSREALRWRPVIVSGSYAGNHYLLDNQVYRGEPGYRLYTPLRLSGTESAVLVERDWLAMGRDRRHVPEFTTPAGEQHLQGRIVPAPATGIMLAEHRVEQVADGRYRVQRIKPQELAAHGDIDLLPYIVRLDQARHSGDDQKAALQGFGRERHLGYAFQWFALAATLVIIYLCVNIKRRRQDNE